MMATTMIAILQQRQEQYDGNGRSGHSEWNHA